MGLVISEDSINGAKWIAMSNKMKARLSSQWKGVSEYTFLKIYG